MCLCLLVSCTGSHLDTSCVYVYLSPVQTLILISHVLMVACLLYRLSSSRTGISHSGPLDVYLSLSSSTHVFMFTCLHLRLFSRWLLVCTDSHLDISCVYVCLSPEYTCVYVYLSPVQTLILTPHVFMFTCLLYSLHLDVFMFACLVQTLIFENGNLHSGPLEALIQHLVPTSDYFPDVSTHSYQTYDCLSSLSAPSLSPSLCLYLPSLFFLSLSFFL